MDNNSCVDNGETNGLNGSGCTSNVSITLYVERCAMFDSFLKDPRRLRNVLCTTSLLPPSITNDAFNPTFVTAVKERKKTTPEMSRHGPSRRCYQQQNSTTRTNRSRPPSPSPCNFQAPSHTDRLVSDGDTTSALAASNSCFADALDGLAEFA